MKAEMIEMIGKAMDSTDDWKMPIYRRNEMLAVIQSVAVCAFKSGVEAGKGQEISNEDFNGALYSPQGKEFLGLINDLIYEISSHKVVK